MNQNSIQEDIKSGLKSGNACYHSVQNLLYSNFLSNNIHFKIYRTIILPVVLYGCETWWLILGEERRLRVFENRVLRIVGPKRDEVTREWRQRLLTEYYSGDKTRREMGEAYSTYGERSGAYRVLVGKPEGKRPLENPMRGLEYNINVNLQELGRRAGLFRLRIGTGGGLL